MNKNSNKIFSICLLSIAIGCNWLIHEPPEIHNIRAEIAEIEKASDTSVLVYIEVLENGNSNGCRLKIFVDTVPVARGVSAKSTEVTSYISDCQLDNFYTINVSRLKKGQEYFFRLFQEAFWDANGTTSHHDYFIGSSQKFTIQ